MLIQSIGRLNLVRPQIQNCCSALVLRTDYEKRKPSFSTTSKQQLFQRPFYLASYLRRRYLKKQYGIEVVGEHLMKDGVIVDNEFAKLNITTPAFFFKLERYWAAGMIPLIPAAYFIHSTPIDIALAVTIALHSHWGILSVVKDYARESVVGENIAEFATIPANILSILLFCGLLHFSFMDIGITKAFELVFSL